MTSFSTAGHVPQAAHQLLQALYLQLAVYNFCPLFTTEGTLQQWSGVSLCIEDKQVSVILLVLKFVRVAL